MKIRVVDEMELLEFVNEGWERCVSGGSDVVEGRGFWVGLGASEPSGLVVDVGASLGGWFEVCAWWLEVSIWCGGGGLECNGEGGVEFPSEESTGGAVDEAVDGGAEGPTDDGGNGNIIAEGDGEHDGVAVGKGVGKDVSDDGAKEAVKVGCIKG